LQLNVTDKVDTMADNPFPISQTLRDLAEQNTKHVHAMYEQLNDFATKAIGAWTGALPPSPVAAGFRDVQGRAVQIAKENAESAFALAEKLTKAQNFQEILTLQTKYAQDRIQTVATQTQELSKLMGDAFQKSVRH
jgi:hypothetical protein